MSNIIITGGAGFIGSHLVDYLLKDKNNQVLVIDDLSEGKLKNLPKNNRLEVKKISILGRNFGKINIFKNIDTVYHLASLTRPRWSIEHPLETNRVNVIGTLRVLKYCLEKRVGKLVFTSSASVYGKQDRLLLSEDMQPNPMSPYALTKKIGEEYCRLYSNIYGLNYSVIRPFNVYGPRQSLYGYYSAAIPNFIHQLSSNKKAYITGKGTQVRDFIYVNDVVRLMAMLGEHVGTGEVFNAGSGKSTSINKLYKTVCKLMNINEKPSYISPVIDPETKADIKKAKKTLNWKPDYDLEEGLKETIASI